jgi:hypothetical protein
MGMSAHPPAIGRRGIGTRGGDDERDGGLHEAISAVPQGIMHGLSLGFLLGFGSGAFVSFCILVFEIWRKS